MVREGQLPRCSTGSSAAIRLAELTSGVRPYRRYRERPSQDRGVAVRRSRRRRRAPYFDLPATGLDTYGRSARGYTRRAVPRRAARLRRDRVPRDADAQRPARHGGVPQHDHRRPISDGENLFDSFATGGGAGLRVLINKRSKTNLCFDVGSASRDRRASTWRSRKRSGRRPVPDFGGRVVRRLSAVTAELMSTPVVVDVHSNRLRCQFAVVRRGNPVPHRWQRNCLDSRFNVV